MKWPVPNSTIPLRGPAGVLMRRLSLLGRFGIMSAIPILLLGLALGQSLDRLIRDRALANATQGAKLIARLGAQPLLTVTDLSQGLDPDRLQVLDGALRKELVGKDVARLNIWNRDHVIIYSDDHQLVGRTFAANDELLSALNGRTASELADPKETHSPGLSQYGQLLEVYVPLRLSPDGPPDGAFELYLPYRPIADQISRDRGLLYLILIVGLLVLYASLFRIVAGASQRLRRHAAEKEFQATHDPLTGLPNRARFLERVTEAITASQPRGLQAAVMIMDLDRFKEINDTLGHQVGDLLLKEIGPRLRGALPETDTIARLGGDEFAVLLPALPDEKAAVQAATRLLDAAAIPFDLAGLRLEVRSSLGIALFPQHGGDADMLLRRAEVAMYAAKQGHKGCELYKASHDPYVPSRLKLIGQLHEAIQKEEQLTLHYQPKVCLRTGHVTGIEALVRWEHPTKGLLLPGVFIPLAEHTGLIRPLTMHVLKTALRQSRAWREQGLEPSISVNLSAEDLRDEEFSSQVGQLLTRSGAAPGCLQLEITESSILADPLCASRVLANLSAMGVRISLDDFGTGYSSLAYLKQLPVDEIKIDKSFVTNMALDARDVAIVRSIIDLGHNLKLEVVAEGVETQDVRRRLVAMGCDLAQGYGIARPMSAADVPGWLRAAPSVAGSQPSAA